MRCSGRAKRSKRSRYRLGRRSGSGPSRASVPCSPSGTDPKTARRISRGFSTMRARAIRSNGSSRSISVRAPSASASRSVPPLLIFATAANTACRFASFACRTWPRKLGQQPSRSQMISSDHPENARGLKARDAGRGCEVISIELRIVSRIANPSSVSRKNFPLHRFVALSLEVAARPILSVGRSLGVRLWNRLSVAGSMRPSESRTPPWA